MDSLQPILPTERIGIHGLDGSRDGQTKTKNQKPEFIKILDEQIIEKCSEKESGVRWLKGAFPHLGIIIKGKEGYETIQKFTRFAI